MISYLYPLALQLHYAQAETSLATNSAAIARELQLHYAQAETLSGGAQMRHFLCVATSLCPSGNAVLASSGPAGWSALQLHYAQAETRMSNIEVSTESALQLHYAQAETSARITWIRRRSSCNFTTKLT